MTDSGVPVGDGAVSPARLGEWEALAQAATDLHGVTVESALADLAEMGCCNFPDDATLILGAEVHKLRAELADARRALDAVRGAVAEQCELIESGRIVFGTSVAIVLRAALAALCMTTGVALEHIDPRAGHDRTPHHVQQLNLFASAS